jgi:sugar phosphate isomerase/epimerase
VIEYGVTLIIHPDSHQRSLIHWKVISMAVRPLGISTSWNAAGNDDGGEIVRELGEVGFRSIEVEYRVSAEAARGIGDAVRAGRVRVLSVHNYTPLGSGEKATSRGGDKRNLASPDECERHEAVELTLRSLRLGRELGAEALVLHLGETDLGKAYFGDLARIVEKEGVACSRAEEVRREIMDKRDSVKDRYLEAALSSLEELLPHAEAAGIVLGIENRYYFHQIPLPEEIPFILGRIGSPFVRYWHDIGHAYVMDALGFDGPDSPHADLPERAFGVHIHDAVFIRDHKAPGSGEIPLAPILDRIPAEAIRIIEVSETVTREDIVRCIPFLETLGLPKP